MNIAKKAIVTSALLLALSAVQASASTVEFTIDNTAFSSEKDGVISQNILEAAPFINESGRTMVPIRAISDALGAEIAWNGDAREVTVKSTDKEVKLTIDSETAYINGTPSTLDCVPVIVSDRTFVPLRFISETLSYNVNYASATRQVIIDDTPIVLSCGEKNLSFAELDALYELLYQTSYDSAIASGMTESDLKTFSVQAALQYGNSLVQTANAFSDIGLSAEDLENIRAFIEYDNEVISMPMSGLNSLIHEKYYFAGGTPIIRSIEANNSSAIDETYNAKYVCAKHILVEDEASAKTVYEKAKAGEDFDSLIAEYNTDPGMSSNPGGYVFTTGTMVAEFETASFALSVGAISEPVKTDYGYHIIKREALPTISAETKTEIATNIAVAALGVSEVPKQLITTEEILNMLN